MAGDILTERQVRALLRQSVKRAGSQLALAEGDYSLQGIISATLSKRRPVTQPKILDLLGIEIVFRRRTRS